MKRRRSEPSVTLFPFLSVLLSAMGVLAFLSISFLMITPKLKEVTSRKEVQFQWVGAPGYGEPIFIRCLEDRIEYFDVFRNSNQIVSLESLFKQIQGRQSDLIKYLVDLVHLTTRIKQQFGSTEYFPLLLVDPKGVLASEVLMSIIEQIDDLNVGLEPMLSHWEIPYQLR